VRLVVDTKILISALLSDRSLPAHLIGLWRGGRFDLLTSVWLLDRVERGVFYDPSEAVFVILGEHQELEPHPDLREESLRRKVQAAIDDPRPGISHEKLLADLKQKLKEPRSAPAEWRRDKREKGC
jgi:hypothetical protein